MSIVYSDEYISEKSNRLWAELCYGSRKQSYGSDGSPLFKHDIRSLTQAVGRLRGHAAVCDVVGIQTQMPQT